MASTGARLPLATEEELLRMSLTGELPEDIETNFNEEKDKGNKAFREGNYHDAIRHYTAAESANPISPVPPANRAMAQLKLKNYQAAKADASVALELQEAGPLQPSYKQLRCKILLRRATANKELMLLALAAEDFAMVLETDPSNAIAKAELADLKTKYHITPPIGPSSSRSGSGRGRIEVVAERGSQGSPTQNGTAPHAQVREKRARPTSLQDETALVELPEHVMDTLVSKWNSYPPRSASEFERAWKSLKGNKLGMAKYLLDIVGESRLAGGVLGETLTPQLLEEIIDVLSVAVSTDAAVSRPVADLLLSMTKVSRFDMLLMFLSPSDKRPFSMLMDTLRRNCVDPHKISALQASYS